MSTQKEWYIFETDHHKGPYSLREIQDLLYFHSLQINTPVWREGESAWRPCGDYLEIIAEVHRLQVNLNKEEVDTSPGPTLKLQNSSRHPLRKKSMPSLSTLSAKSAVGPAQIASRGQWQYKSVLFFCFAFMFSYLLMQFAVEGRKMLLRNLQSIPLAQRTAKFINLAPVPAPAAVPAPQEKSKIDSEKSAEEEMHWQTLLSLLEQTQELFEQVLPTLHKGDEVAVFEDQYAQNIGVMLSEFTAMDLPADILPIIQSLGLTVMETIAEVKMQQYLSPHLKINLQKNFAHKLQLLKRRIADFRQPTRNLEIL